ncbi:DinB family protein [Marinilongibacter aquaticus]|uniref:DinB family protein n=1 Tax=Marinilongibacter aquaticus TaxID=2975157 RepID=UPI0021BD27CE|nr:DinB family protein [Marinilongibacter aquaticus]UBM60235.1 DinB family protein [Marinilongibacter aquaticus]
MKELEEIAASLRHTFALYAQALQGYNAKGFESKKDEHSWSLAQMYAHLYVTGYVFFLANINRCLEKRKGREGEQRSPIAEAVLQANAFPNKKFKVPGGEEAENPQARSLSFYRENWTPLLEDILAKMEDIKQDEGQYRTLHPVLGWSNAHEWFQHMDIHLRHHLRQKSELEEALQ